MLRTLILVMVFYLNSGYLSYARAGDVSSGATSSLSASVPTSVETSSSFLDMLASDLEYFLITHNQVMGEIRRDNMSLFRASIEFNRSSAIKDLIASVVVSFMALKGAAHTLTTSFSNGRRAVQTAKNLKSINQSFQRTKIRGPSFRNSTAAMLISAGVGAFYVTSTLFQKGLCVFSCVDKFSARVLENREGIFLKSQTFEFLEEELGEDLALRYFSVLKGLRDDNFSDMAPLLRFLDMRIKQKIPSDLTKIEVDKKPVFAETVRVFGTLFELTNLIDSYLENFVEESCKGRTPQECDSVM